MAIRTALWSVIVMLALVPQPAAEPAPTPAVCLAQYAQWRDAARSDPVQAAVLDRFMLGVAEAFTGYFIALRQHGRDMLFCPPKGLSMSLDELYDMLDTAAQEAEPAQASRCKTGVLATLLADFRRLFPCS